MNGVLENKRIKTKNKKKGGEKKKKKKKRERSFSFYRQEITSKGGWENIEQTVQNTESLLFTPGK